MTAKRVVLIAAEDGALPDGRLTSIGEATLALPRGLAAHGWHTTVVSPAWRGPARPKDGKALTLPVRFAGAVHDVSAASAPSADDGIAHVLLGHRRLLPQGPGKIYCSDDPREPFATDATKFAFFCAAAVAYVRQLQPLPDVVHVHGWHGGLYFALRAFDDEAIALRAVRSVFSIHSLALQGQRPLAFAESSLRSWFPTLSIPRHAVIDPQHEDCVNPAATAIRLADAVNAGSPTFAEEICRPARHGLRGGYGLHALLRDASVRGRLCGILDGWDAPPAPARKPPWRPLAATLAQTNLRWLAGDRYVRSTHFVAAGNLAELPRARPAVLLTACGPLGDDEMALYRRPAGRGRSVLEAILAELQGSERFVFLGAGHAQHERFLTGIAARDRRLVFLCGTDPDLAQRLRLVGDIHLLLHVSAAGASPALAALGAGQPCVAHAVGGLADVVRDNVNGWLFAGQTPAARAREAVAAVRRACAARRAGGKPFARLARAAATTRHDWSATARATIERLYTGE